MQTSFGSPEIRSSAGAGQFLSEIAPAFSAAIVVSLPLPNVSHLAVQVVILHSELLRSSRVDAL